jgi:hypothetical protein
LGCAQRLADYVVRSLPQLDAWAREAIAQTIVRLTKDEIILGARVADSF